MKKIKTWTLGVVMMMFCMCIMVMTPNTAWAAVKATDSNATSIQELMDELKALEGYEITVDHVIEIDGGDYEVNLNNNTVIFEDSYFYVKKGSLTLKKGTIDERGGYAAILMTGSTDASAKNYSNVVIKPSATIKGDDGILLRYTQIGKSYGMTVDMQGHIIAANAGININGNIVNDKNTAYGATINVSGTIKATNDDGVGIYQAGYANTTISGSNNNATQVIGKMSGIEVRAGKLIVNANAEIIGEAIPASYKEFYNGSTIYGAGVAVSPHDTSMPIDVALESGATIHGYRPVYVVESNNVVPDVVINGATLRLVDNPDDHKITYSEMLTISNGDSVILDLNGNTLEFDSNARGKDKNGKTVANIFVEKGSLTVQNGSIHEKNADYAPIMVSGSTDKNESKYSVVTIKENVSLFGWAGVFVRENGNAAYGVEITMNGNIVSAEDGSGTTGSGIYINGNITEKEGNVPKITVGKTGSIASSGVGILMAGYADVTLNGGENSWISADESGIEIRAGKLTVNGGTICSNYNAEVSVVPNSNGSTTKGAGIAIAQHNTRIPVSVVINDGKIDGTTSVYESDPENGDSTDVKLDIKGGSFSINGNSQDTIYSQNLERFISSGVFATAPKSDYIVSGYKAAQNTDGQWEIVADGSVPVLIKEGSEITVYAGEDFTLTAVTTPEAPVTWEINEKKPLVTYNVETGTFTAKAYDGETWVKATVQVGGDPENTSSAKCTIKVLKQELSAETLALSAEEKATLTVNGKATKGITWSSDDAAIAAVDQNGNVTAVSAGTATITATVNKVVKLLCTVTVSEKEVAATQGNTGTNVDPVTMEAKKNAAVSEAISDITVPEGVDADDFKNSVEGAVAGAISEAVDTVKTDVLENTVATQPVEGLAEAAETALKNQELKENEKALVYVNVVLEDVDVDVTTTVDENNEVTAAAVPTKLTFTVEPFVKVFDADGNVKGEDTKIENKDLNGTFKVRLPIPSSITEKYATIVHKSTGYADKTYTLPVKEENGQKYVEMTLTHFSTFEVSFTNTKPSTGSTGGGSYSTVKKVEKKATAVAGAWAQDANGWWYRYADGTWPAAKWVELDWNGEKTWYYFNPNGYMHSGWLLDGGNWYFLHNVADGTQGYMYTGWKQIDGKWYYFNPLMGGPMGSLLVNTVTPNGYTVDANGVWIQ